MPTEPAAQQKRQEFDALLRWWDKLSRTGEKVPDSLSEAVLRTIAYSPYRNESQIRSVLQKAGVSERFLERYTIEIARALADTVVPPAFQDTLGENPERDGRASIPATPGLSDASGNGAAEDRSEQAITPPPPSRDGPVSSSVSSNIPTSQVAAGPPKRESSPPPPPRNGGTKGRSEDRIDPDGFAPCALGLFDGAMVDLIIDPLDNGAYEISWPARPSKTGVSVFRVVIDDYEQLVSPDSGKLVYCGRGLSATDVDPYNGPIRYIQVWCNSGPSVAESKAALPHLYGEGVVVAPVQNVVVQEEAGQVRGEWNVFAGVQRVHVFRSTAQALRSHAQEAPRGLARSGLKIQPDQRHLEGFVDETAERGHRYLYEIVAEVSGGNLSPAVGVVVNVSVDLRPVKDLDVVHHDSESDARCDVSWTPPDSGRVIVFRTKEAPSASPEDGILSRERLSSAGLRAEEMLNYPPLEFARGKVGYKSVPWPKDWPKAYFTPVSVHGDYALVGISCPSIRANLVTDAVLRERVIEQRLTFAWPEGAHNVLVFLAVPGVPTAAVLNGAPLLNISEARYKEPLGVKLPFALPPERSSTLHLVPVTYEGGRPCFGKSTLLTYPGLARVRYRIEVKRKRLIGGRFVEVTIGSDLPLRPPPKFALVVRPDRLPLSINDGEALRVVPIGRPGQEAKDRILMAELGPPQGPGWVADLESVLARLEKVRGKSATTYYLRLFADLPAPALRSVAVLDPPIWTLTTK